MASKPSLQSMDTNIRGTDGEVSAAVRPAHHYSRQPGQKRKAYSGPEKPVAPELTSATGVKFPSTSKYSQSKEQARSTSINGNLSNDITTKAGAGHADVSSKKNARSVFARGTRGRGDPRNEAMRQARQRYMESKSARNTANQQRRPDSMSFKSGPISGLDQDASHVDASDEYQNRAPVNSGFLSQGRRTQNHGQSIPVHGPPSDLRPNNRFMRPEPRAPISSSQHPKNGRGPFARREDDWTHWLELSVRLSRLEPSVKTRDLWRTFSKEGPIISVELFEDHNGHRDGKGRVKFGPPPAKAFWLNGQYIIEIGSNAEKKSIDVMLEPRKRMFLAPSPVNPMIKYPEVMTLVIDTLDFGIMYEESTMMGMYQVSATPRTGITFRHSMLHREINVDFYITKQETEHYRFNMPFQHLHLIQEVGVSDKSKAILISLAGPPRFDRKDDEADTFDDKGKFWSERESWYRQTEIVQDRTAMRNLPLTLKKVKPVIDIGRWTTYRFEFKMTEENNHNYGNMCRALRDYNIKVEPMVQFKFIKDCEPAVWDYIDKPLPRMQDTSDWLHELIAENVPHLSFPVRYQLEVCISNGCLNEHNLTRDFVDKLIATEEQKAKDLLEYVANQGRRIFNPMEIFELKVLKGNASRAKIPHYCTYTRSATVTPSTVYYSTPTVETSNRVVRQYAEYADRFLRVRFTDEKAKGKINATDGSAINEVLTRIKRTMNNGMTIGDRHFEFLAFGNSQFREHGAYFFAPLPYRSADDIRAWMGDFSRIKGVAKHASRLGQCFSTTRAINGTKVNIREIADVNRNGRDFTDGVGKISRFLAQVAASELGISTGSREPPSVYQFRLGGCKGVLALSPDVDTRDIHIRKTQYKFAASHEGLEIIRWSQFAAANLNRQIILVLSALGVPDEVFVEKLKAQLLDIQRAMTDKKTALNMLQKDIDPNQMTLVIAGLVLDGFQKEKEPFLMSLLHLWRAWSIKYLKEKARITINKGAFLLGCVDETATLKGHIDNAPPVGPDSSSQHKFKYLPQIFVQLSKGPTDKPIIMEGPMLLARNPSLHPGDMRVVNGVNVPALHHLKDVVVFPQTGDYDIPGMCSGGDLDGDDFLVMWDNELMPQEWNHKPMDYSAPPEVKLNRVVSIDDITSFFVRYMKNDTLGAIATAHMAMADWADDGIRNEKCLKLAELHSKAVDYVKTGVPAHMPKDLYPRKWPHFMEKFHKPKEQIYTSYKVLGQLYDQVERVDFVPIFDAPFDSRILNAYDIDRDLMKKAADLKQDYDAAVRRIMAQHEIGTEFEVWSTFVLHHANANDYKFHEEMGRTSQALKDRFRIACHEKAGSKAFEVMGPFVAAMYRVTYEEMQQAVAECREVKFVSGVEKRVRRMVASSMPLMSFPWLFHDILGKIANGEMSALAAGKLDVSRAVQIEGKVTTKRDRPDLRLAMEEDVLQTTEGVTHRGEVLELFQDRDEDRNEVEKAENHEGTSIDKQQSTAPVVKVGSLIDIDGDDAEIMHRDPITATSSAFAHSMTVDELLDSDPLTEHTNLGASAAATEQIECDEGDVSSDTPIETPEEDDLVTSPAGSDLGKIINNNHTNGAGSGQAAGSVEYDTGALLGISGPTTLTTSLDTESVNLQPALVKYRAIPNVLDENEGGVGKEINDHAEEEDMEENEEVTISISGKPTLPERWAAFDDDVVED